MERFAALRGIVGTVGLAAMLHAVPVRAQSPGPSTPVASPAVAPDQVGAWLYYLAAEVQTLRSQVLHLRLESLAARIERIERDLQKARQKQAEVQMRETQHEQQVAEATELANQQLDPEQRTQLEAIRAELSAGGVDRLRTERVEAASAEAELAGRLQREKAQYAQLEALARQMPKGAAKQ